MSIFMLNNKPINVSEYRGGKIRKSCAQTELDTAFLLSTLEELLHEDGYLSPVVGDIVTERAVFI